MDVLPKALGGQFGATALLLPACLIAVGPLLLAADSFTVVTPPFGEPRTVAELREGRGYGPMLRAVNQAIGDGLLEHPGEFFGTPATPDAVDAALAALPGKLAGLVAAVRDRAPRARVLLVDYLTVLPDGVGCNAAPMTEEDLRSCVDLGRRLEAATAEAARLSGAELVEASAISREHTVCDPEPWVTGWEFGDRMAGGVGPYHPNAAGMRVVAEAVVGTATR